MKNNKFVEACLNGGIDIFKEIKTIRGKTKKVPSKIDSKANPEDIASHFKDIYENLYNSEPSADEVNEMNKNLNLNEEDLSIVDLVNAELIKIAIDKLKCGKSDVLFDFGSDAFIKARDTVAEPIAFLFRTFLIHGFVPTFLLLCSLVPIVKDKLGCVTNSDNYRAIAISKVYY